MFRKVLRTPSFPLCFFLFFALAASGQEVIRFEAAQALPEQDEVIREHFASYTLATLNTEEVSTLLRSSGYFKDIRIMAAGMNIRFDLIAHDLRAPGYVLRVLTDEGIIDMPRSPNKTWAGYTHKGHYDVRITADNDYFSAMIVMEDDEIYIEPARNIFRPSPSDQFVIYRASDNLKKLTFDGCGTHHHTPAQYQDHDDTWQDRPTGARDDDRSAGRACKVVQIALADDLLMFNQYGSIAAVENHNMTVINNVQTNYDNEFVHELQFTVVTIFVVTSAGSNPWTNSTDPEALLDDFTDWAPSGFGTTHDIASLWSNRNFNGSTVGLAWLNSVCSPFRYNVLEDFTSNANHLRVLQAHEMGHNFAAGHDAPASGFIMAPSVNNSTTWSTASQNAINNKINSVGCLSNCSAPLPPVAAFTGSPTSGCTPMVVTFTNQSQNNPTSYSWSFPGGTPSTSTAQHPTVTYNTPGTYNVSLTATNSQGSNTLTKPNYITVGQGPNADFSFTVNGTSVDFENESTGATSYLWNFGDGTTSTTLHPIHNYADDGTYVVTLTATNSCGSDVFTQVIQIITPPFAGFSSNITSGCQPFEVSFINLSSPNATSFFWSFPGGIPATSSAYQPVVLYEIPGTYNVTLTAYNSAGDDEYSVTGYITVLPLPAADFTSLANGLEVSFNSAGSIGNTFFWNFGDGSVSSAPNPVHVYTTGGLYTVQLTVTNECGSETVQGAVNVTGAPVALFSSNSQFGCSPFVVQFTNQSAGNPTQYSWVFEGGSPPSSTQANPTVVFNSPGTFDVELTVINAAGSNTVFFNDYIEVGYPATSDFSFTVNGASVTFQNQSQHATSQIWTFGDGGGSNLAHPAHTYAADGVYTVTLISHGDCGADTSTAQVTIQTPPNALFTFQASGNCAPATVHFVNESSANATSFLWSFPGGIPSTSTLAEPVVTYAAAGAYDVTLIAFSPGGADTMTWPAYVIFDIAPDASFLIATENLTVSFTNQTTGATSYSWDFGDGGFSTQANPVYTYPAFGAYTITLIASNPCGSDTSAINIVLGTSPNAFFTYDTHTGCVPFTVQFIDQSQNSPSAWNWIFESGTPATSTLQNPVVQYTTPGVYSVTLQVTNGNGTDVLVLDGLIKAGGPPDATFISSQHDNVVYFEYQGIAFDSLRWHFGDGGTDNSLNPTVHYTAPGQYQVSLIVYNPCGSDTSSVWIMVESTATGEPGASQAGWQIRPNPFNDVLTLYGQPLHDGEVVVSFLDVHGRLIQSESWTYPAGEAIKKWRTDRLPTGVIFVAIRDRYSNTVLKAVKH